MDDLVQFLRARLDEEQADAEAASPGPWTVNAEGDEVLAVDGITVADGFALSDRQLRATTAHIVRHDPARVLAEVDSKRAAIEHYEKLRRYSETERREEYILAEGAAAVMLKILALPYADHDDYKEKWRP